jgi:acyl dehydratase
MKVFESLDALQAAVGTEVAVTDWLPMTQERVNRFADATDDYQWIHVDTDRAANGPFGGTIAHGFLTLSLLPRWMAEAVDVRGVRLVINYGVNRVRFPAPVRVGARVRARLQLQSFEPLPSGGAHLCWLATVQIEGQPKPACVAELLLRYVV